jgi:hypothetical protein
LSNLRHGALHADREAISGRTFTDLAAEERIEFTSHDQVVIYWPEQVVAAAQLRLLKNYVDYHADELYAQWRQNGLQTGAMLLSHRLFSSSKAGTCRCGPVGISPTATLPTS